MPAPTRHTLSSRLTEHDPRPEPWLNFGGRSFNSTQELTLFTLYRHLVAEVSEIVLLSGFNNLGLARLPASARGEHGAFFNCNQFFEALPAGSGRQKPVRSWLRRGRSGAGRTRAGAEHVRTDRLRRGSDAASSGLLAGVRPGSGRQLTFVLQPLSGWVRPIGTPEEERLFAELDELGNFSQTYGDILQQQVCRDYADAIEAGTRKMDVGFSTSARCWPSRSHPINGCSWTESTSPTPVTILFPSNS